MPFVSVSGAEVWYEDRGAGQTVLLVHGGLFDRMRGERFWVRPGIADDLVAAGYRVLVPDRRFGDGRTSADYAAHSWEIEAADLVAVLADAGVPSAHVVTGSNGCSVAARLALARPDVVGALVLGWPGLPDSGSLWEAFARSAAEVEASGPAAYLDMLDRQGYPRPGEPRPGFPYGVALCNDERARRSFLELQGSEAAQVMRASASNMLTAGPLRGVSQAELRALGKLAPRVIVLPADPEDPFHTRAAAEALAAAIPDARLFPGTAVSPSPRFAEQRANYLALLRQAFTLA